MILEKVNIGRVIKFWFGVICLVNLHGCAINSNINVKSLEQLTKNSWEIDGRIFLQDEEDAVNAKFTWIQEGVNFKCIIRGPFGLEKIIIEGDDFGIQDIISDDNSTDIKTVLEQKIAILDFKYWLLGVPNPGSISAEISQSQGYIEFEQNNWIVKINKYQNNDSHNLPKNIQARNSTSNLKIIIDNWRL